MPGASSIRARLRDQRGVTLVEFLIAAAAGLTVAGCALMLMIATVNTERDSGDRASSIRDARTGLERMTRELRQATSVVRTTDPSRIVFSKLSSGATVWVLYECSASECRRAEGATAPASATAEVVTGVEPSQAAPQPAAAPLADDGCNTTLTGAPAVGVYDVFSVTPATTGQLPRVCVRLRVEKGKRSSSRERRENVLADSATLRNAGVGS